MLKQFDRDQVASLAYTGSLINGAVHNLNTPLSSIMGRADILRLRCERLVQRIEDADVLHEIDKCRRDVGLIIDNCNRISALVMNAVYRCDTSSQNGIQPVSIARVLQEDLAFLLSDMEFKHNVEKRFDLDMSIPPVLGSPVHFSNAFIEIIENALAAMRDSSVKVFAVSVQAGADGITAAISDSGCGMDEQTHRMVMETLEHAPQSRTVPVSGLAYAALLLQPYAPRYRVETRPGSTTVAVTFPVRSGS